MKKIFVLCLCLFFAGQIQADDKDHKGGPKDKPEQVHGNQKKEKHRTPKEEKANKAARLEKRIARLNELADKLEAKGNAAAAKAIREKALKAKDALHAKKKKVGLTDEDVKAQMTDLDIEGAKQ